MRFLRRLWWQCRRVLTLRCFQTVVLVGKNGPFREEQYHGRVDQVWGIGFAYKFHPRVDRLFCLDHRSEFIEFGEHADYIAGLNRAGIPFYAQNAWPDVPTSQAYDLDRLRRDLGAPDYYTSSIAYAFAEAIRQGYGTIVCHEIVAGFLSVEYMEQKPCLDWWAGVAFGMGINVEISERCQIARPLWWQSELYGYVTQDTWKAGAEIMARAYREAARLPRIFRRHADEA